MAQAKYGRIGGTRAFDLVLLTWAAGMLDALCYLRAHVFAANMTGNIVLLGLNLVRDQEHRGEWNLAAIAAFIAGALLAGALLFRRRAPMAPPVEVKAGLSIELPFLLAFAALCSLRDSSQSGAIKAGVIVAGAAAMGVQSIAVRRLKIAGVATTFMTGTMTSAIADWLSGERQVDSSISQPLLLAAMLVTYFAAAATTALFHSTTVPTILPFLCVAAVRVRWPADG
ncbi:MAG TPA: YoaK family protein [Bryobacteraceae bacterium]|nr:YoaK family protein [Bryobacteraceae bacterium]